VKRGKITIIEPTGYGILKKAETKILALNFGASCMIVGKKACFDH
jgi:hypothetical protein